MTKLYPFALVLLITGCGATTQKDCNASTCQGCCTADGKCEAGNTSNACGNIGGMCRDCAGLGLTCTLGTCSSIVTGNGGGSGGGTTGGGTGGGITGGGTGGGTTGGGTGGGAMGGGTGGGAMGGGTGGGGTSAACNVNNGGCAAEAICTPQGATRICTCNTGYVGDGFSCSDVNECLSNNGGCSTIATCANTIGSRTCTCMSGYSGDGVTCSDIDECMTNNGGCNVNASCTNTTGSRTCACVSGYMGDGYTCTQNVPTWTIETAAFLGGSTSSIALDSSENPAIAYTSDSPRGVHFRRRLGTSSWSSAEQVDTSTNAFNPSMVFSSGFVLANSVSNVSSAYVAGWRRSTTSASWTTQGTLNGPEQPDLAIGGGREHLVANTRISGMPNSTVSYLSRTAGSSAWGSPVTISSTASWGEAKIASNPSGQLAVVFTRNSDSTLWLARSSGSGTTWSTTQVTTSRVWSADVAMDTSGVIFIGYYTPDSHLIRFEEWSGSTRLSQTTVDSPGGTGLGSQWFSGVAIAGDGLGDVHMSYLDFTRGQSLRYATNRSGSWVAETVTTADDVLGETSIVTDSTFAPHISFPLPASSFGNLGYAVKR